MKSDSSALVTEQYMISDQEEVVNTSASRFQFIDKFCLGIIAANILLMPIFFGGVHEQIYLLFRSLTFTAAGLLVLFRLGTVKEVLRFQSPQGKGFYAICLVFAFTCLHSLAFYLIPSAHPVLNSVPSLLNPVVVMDSIIELMNFLALYSIACYSLRDHANVKFILGLTLTSAFIVSLVALAHWFYDNGKLFWTFSPDYNSISTRARWPFVNPNHLGIFLIIPLFLAIGKFYQGIAELKLGSQRLSRRGKVSLSELITDKESQKLSRSVLIIGMLLLTFGLALIASLSRNANLSALFCLILFFLFPNKKKSKLVPARKVSSVIEVTETDDRRQRVRTSRRSRRENIDVTGAVPIFRIIWKFVLILGTIGVFWFFLGEKGGDLFKSRLEYALIYTQDDMRWQLYADSMPMLASNYLWGIGLGNWPILYPQFMAEGLSGMEPGYLHSDLLQFAIELGLVGTVLFLGLAIYVTRAVLIFRARNNSSSTITALIEAEATFRRAALLGFFAVFLSASFEFPLRIPAITAMLGVAMALILTYQEDFASRGLKRSRPRE